jgi:hypothetical protein
VAAAAGLEPHAEEGAGAADRRSSQPPPPAAEEGGVVDQPEAGRGGTGGRLEGADAHGSAEEVVLGSAHPDTVFGSATQPESALVEEAAVAAAPQLNDSGRAGSGGLTETGAAGACEIKSSQPDEVEAAEEDSPQPKEAGRGGTGGLAVATAAGAAQASEELVSKSPQPLDAAVAGAAASPQPPELEDGTENDEDDQSEETGREEDDVSASMSSILTFGLGADGKGGRAFLDGLAPAGSGGGAAKTGGTGRGGRTRG